LEGLKLFLEVVEFILSCLNDFVDFFIFYVLMIYKGIGFACRIDST